MTKVNKTTWLEEKSSVMECSTFTTGKLLPIRLISQRTVFSSLSNLKPPILTVWNCNDQTVIWRYHRCLRREEIRKLVIRQPFVGVCVFTVDGFAFKLKKRAAWFFSAFCLQHAATCSTMYRLHKTSRGPKSTGQGPQKHQILGGGAPASFFWGCRSVLRDCFYIPVQGSPTRFFYFGWDDDEKMLFEEGFS